VGRSLAQVLAGTGIRLELVDARPDQLEHPEMPTGVIRHQAHGPDFVRTTLVDAPACHVAVMTHSHELDLELIKALLPLAPAWLGLMGSGTKWNRFRSALAEAGFTEEQIHTVECPLGLRTTGREPREIAIGLAAELLERVHAAT
jgi:xanthine dehydrogenase accessory factor